MDSMNCRKFKGEIEKCLCKEKNIFESRMDRVFRMLNIKTKLNRTNIRKKDGYHASHLLFIVSLLPLLKIPTIHSFCRKQWYQWCVARKDAFYRFKRNPSRWRSFIPIGSGTSSVAFSGSRFRKYSTYSKSSNNVPPISMRSPRFYVPLSHLGVRNLSYKLI